VKGPTALLLQPSTSLYRVGTELSVGHAPAQGEPLATRDILIIDDNYDACTLLREALQAQGYDTDVAPSADDGLALLQQARYRILLLDMLPSVQGHALLRTFQDDPALRPATILVLPSQDQEISIRMALAAGADDYLTTPVELADLIRQVKLWLRGVERTVPGGRAHHAGLQIHTLGSFSVEYKGEVRLSEVGKARKACMLFKLLLTHHGRPVPASTVYELLWPQAPESVAASDLRSMLYQLRRLLDVPGRGAWPIEHIGPSLRLCLNHNDWWDADEFSMWLREAAKLQRAGATDQAVAAYRAALALYAGEYLQDDPLEDWARTTRDQLCEDWRKALEALATLYGERGDCAEQERLLRVILCVDPFREQCYRALMRLLATQGRSAEALVVYRDLRNLLHSELDTGPDPQTQALAMQIRQPV